MNEKKQDIIDRAVEYIKEKIAPDQIFLFGSHARGTAGPDSDLDFFIIKNTVLPKIKRTAPLYSLDKSRKIGAPIGIDFIVYTPQEFEKSKNIRNSLAAEIIKTGKLIYDNKR